jgi:sulfopyruvate decarboxylase TPP-binding subunit
VYDALKASEVRFMSALPETWLVHLIRVAEEDPHMTLVRLAKEEEGVGIYEALGAGDLTTIVAKVEAVGPSGCVTDLSLLENRFQFARSLRS